MNLVKILSKSGFLVTGATIFTVATTGMAQAIVLTFEGLGDLESVENFYDGGLGGNGSGPGPDYDITFSSNSLAAIDADAGGSGNFGGEPSPDTTMFFLDGPAAVMNAANGFTTGFSFYYSAVNSPGFINVYDDLNGTGNLLATLNLPTTPFNGAPDPNGVFSPLVPIGVAFSGTAKSVDFGGTVNQIGFDNITLGSDIPDPTPIPEPLTILGTVSAGIIGTLMKKKQKQQA
jgi:hypothetical protein